MKDEDLLKLARQALEKDPASLVRIIRELVREAVANAPSESARSEAITAMRKAAAKQAREGFTSMANGTLEDADALEKAGQ